MSFWLSTQPGDAIPDSGLLHNYDWSASTTTTSLVEDDAGTDDLDTGSFTNLSNTINGVQVGYFDGVDDLIRATTTITQPVDVYIVYRSPNATLTITVIVIGGVTTFFQPLAFTASNDSRAMYAGTTLGGSSLDTNNHISLSIFNGANSEMQLDTTTEATGDAGTNDTSGITVGADKDDSRYAEFYIGQLLYYDPTASGYSRADVHTFLSDKWGIAI